MVATQAQIEANRRNARQSTGPKSLEGKEKSRANAVTHGGSNAGPVNRGHVNPVIRRLFRQFRDEYQPRGIEETSLVAILARSAYAQTCWSEEELKITAFAVDDEKHAFVSRRRAEAAHRLRRISREPEYTVAYLKTSATGIDVLLDRWNELLAHVEHAGDLDDDAQRMLEDLLGRNPLLRPALHILDPIPGETKKAKYIRLIQNNVARLKADRDRLAPFLDKEFELSLTGAFFEEPPALRRARRYGTEAFRQFKWATERLIALREGSARPLAVKPVWVKEYDDIGFVSELCDESIEDDSETDQSTTVPPAVNPVDEPSEAPSTAAPTPAAPAASAPVATSTASPQINVEKEVAQQVETKRQPQLSRRKLKQRAAAEQRRQDAARLKEERRRAAQKGEAGRSLTAAGSR